jgi:hypothetical protein
MVGTGGAISNPRSPPQIKGYGAEDAPDEISRPQETLPGARQEGKVFMQQG